MAVTPEDLHALAESLVEPERSEASVRAGVSRAYYAAFHKCKSYAESVPLPGLAYTEESRGSHDNLIKRFQTYNENKMDDKSRAVKSVGYMLQASRNHRVKADYEIYTGWTDTDTREAFKYVAGIFKKLSALEDL